MGYLSFNIAYKSAKTYPAPAHTFAMSVFDYFDQIQIINLPHRTDRRREMEDELHRIGLKNDPRVHFFSAIRPDHPARFSSIGARGVYESQTTILREAAAANQSVLILEDDCEFVTDASSYKMPAHWDIFYGGHVAARPDDLVNSDIIGAHMMGFSRDGVKLVNKYLEQLDYDGMHPPIDAAYVWCRRANPEVPTHFAVPPLANQRSSRSDIAQLKWFDRLPLISTMANSLRTVLRKNRAWSDFSQSRRGKLSVFKQNNI